jgi:heptosyltransferase-2
MAHHMAFVDPIDVRDGARKPVIKPVPGEIETARDLLESFGVETRRPNRPRIGIHPGGKWAVKRWPAGSFADLTGQLTSGWNAAVVVFTGPGELEYSAQLRDSVGNDVVFLPELPVRTVAAALSLLDGMVVSDGGIMHLSVAVGTPTVGIFGSAEPDIWFPYETFGPFAPAIVPMECRPCHRHECPLGHTDCLNKLTPDIVLEKLRGVFSTPRDKSGADGTAGAEDGVRQEGNAPLAENE